MLWHEWNFWSRYKQMNAAILRKRREFMWISCLAWLLEAVQGNSWVYQRFTATGSVLIIIKNFSTSFSPGTGFGAGIWLNFLLSSPTSTPRGRWISDVKSYCSLVHHYTSSGKLKNFSPGSPDSPLVKQYTVRVPTNPPFKKEAKPNSFLFEKSSFMCVDWKMNGGKAKEAKKNFSSFNNRKNFEQSRKIEYD